MRKGKLFLIIILLSTPLVFTQVYKGKAKLLGYVYDEEFKPIEGVKIKFFSLKAQAGFETETDSQGKWKALYVTGKMWDVDFEKKGYLPKRLNVNVYEHNENPPILIKMKKIDGIILSVELKSKLKEGNRLYDHNKFLDAIYQLGLVYLFMGNKLYAINAFEDYLEHDADSKRATQVKGFIDLLKKS